MGQLTVILLASLQICCLFSVIANAQARGSSTVPLGPAPTEHQIGPGEINAYTITLEENTYLQVVVDQHGVDVIVKTYSPDGKTLGEFDSPNGSEGPEPVSLVAAQAGTYRLEIMPLNPQDTATGRYQIRIVEQRKATEQELKSSTNREATKAKGLALLGEVDGIIPEIRSPQTRIRAEMQAAQLLWGSDDKRAQKYLADAANDIKEFIGAIDLNTDYSRDYNTISQLRYETIMALAPHDADAALNLLYSTKMPPDPYGNQRERVSQESGLELAVADQIARNDPRRTLEIARQSLKHRLSPSLINTLAQLRQQDQELAIELGNEIATRLRDEKLLKNSEIASLAINFVRLCHNPRRGQRQSPAGPSQFQPFLPENTCHDLAQKALQEALSFSLPAGNGYTPERDAAWNLLNGLQSFGPELDSMLPGSMASVEKKLAEMNTSGNPNMAVIQRYQNTINNNAPDAAAAEIAKAPAEVRDQLFLQLANRTAASGDGVRARQIVNDHISNAFNRRQALTNFDQQEMYNAIAKGKIEDALRAIANLRTPRERANMLMQIARQIGPGQKRATALNLLEQARSLLGPSVQAQDQEQMNALLELIKAFARYDSKRAFELLEPLIDQLNDLCTAARTLEGFGTNNYDNDELDLQTGSSVANVAIQLSGALGTLAIANFERAKLTTDRLRLPEVRLRAYLDIAQQTIQPSR